MFGAPHPSEAVIAALKDEVTFLREQNLRLQDRLIALTNPAALAAVKRLEAQRVAPTVPETVITQVAREDARKESAFGNRRPFTPARSNAEIHSDFRR